MGPWFRQWSWAWPARPLVRYIFAAALLIFVTMNYIIWSNDMAFDVGSHSDLALPLGPKHPIKKLMVDARARHEALLAKRSMDLHDAAVRYRARRGRHPPPGFDKWVQAALKSKAIIVEDFFDRIYQDLNPYWALNQKTLARRAAGWHWSVKVRNGKAIPAGDTTDRVPWLQLWTDLVAEFAEHLPDVDMPINYMDESRLLVPFDDISRMVEEERKNRHIVPVNQVVTSFGGLADVDAENPQPYDPVWLNGTINYWEHARMTCHPKSPSRNVPQVPDLSVPVEYPKQWAPNYAYQGFVHNWTAAKDPCLQPHLRQMHGTFVESMSQSTSKELIPLFGGSKLPMNNEILIPGAMYLTQDEFYSGGENHGPSWGRKKEGAVWRGDATGGHAKPSVWHRFHRHRLLQMLNGTTVSRIEHEDYQAPTFDLPPQELYNSTLRREKRLGGWLKGHVNAGFIHLVCEAGNCTHMTPHYRESAHLPMKEQYKYKLLPDTDGNSYSARFRGFLRSTSAPLKATIYSEWHDDRLQPWVHFIPFDNTYQDIYSVLEYFTDQEIGGDAAARYIADRGKEWAEKVLRREDMKLYVWRLLLEWARICDENRHNLGFIKDMVGPRRL